MKTYLVAFDFGEYEDNYIAIHMAVENESEIEQFCREAIIANSDNGIIKIPGINVFARREDIQTVTWLEIKED